MSTHMCDITIPGLPKVLVGHVVPKLSIASLIGIRVLCDKGCKVVFTKTKCDVWYKGKVILSGKKDPSTDLWTLPIYADSGQKLDVVPNHPKKWNSTVSQNMVQDAVPDRQKWNSTVSQKSSLQNYVRQSK
jgi:hypothetical protein